MKKTLKILGMVALAVALTFTVTTAASAKIDPPIPGSPYR